MSPLLLLLIVLLVLAIAAGGWGWRAVGPYHGYGGDLIGLVLLLLIILLLFGYLVVSDELTRKVSL